MTGQIYDMELVAKEQVQYEYDYFLLAPNIEKRSRQFFLKFKDKCVFKKVIIIDYANFHKDISD